MYTIGVDTGGTFTDIVISKDDSHKVIKVLSTPENPSKAILKGLSEYFSDYSKINEIIHGTTVATNALLERKGAITALITTKGFEDVIEIKRQNRTELYNLFWHPKPVIVKNSLRFGITERIDYKGDILEKLDDKEIAELINKLKKKKVDSIAVCLINSYSNPVHENKLENKLKELNIPITISSKLVPEFREYERTSTTVVNSYLIPKVKNYMTSLSKSLSNNKLSIMQSNGGLVTTKQASNEPSKIILSGPAGGVVAAFKTCDQINRSKIITYDMGGTSTDISLCNGSINFTTESIVDEIPIKLPMIDISTIGAGGGSIAYIDEGGILKVGPQSAGADPGPACYGKGNLPTVTDANVLLGRIDPGSFLNGKMKIDVDKSRKAIASLALKVKDVKKIAESIINVANSNMERALRLISISKGYDPREFSFVSFGGAGGLHAFKLAKSLNAKEIIFPNNAGVFSATGMILAESYKDYSISHFSISDNLDFNDINNKFVNLEKKAYLDFKTNELFFEKYVDCRYSGQSHELTIPYNEKFINNFHKEHKKNYSYAKKKDNVETTVLRLRAYIKRPNIKIPKINGRKNKVNFSVKSLINKNNKIKVNVYKREQFYKGFEFEGPCVIMEDSSTIFIPDKSISKVDKFGNIITELK